MLWQNNFNLQLC